MGTASAATLQIDGFERSEMGTARAALDDFLAGYTVKRSQIETFEGHHAWDGTDGTRNPQGTRVGSFTTRGGKGTGQAAINGGLGTEVRGDNGMEWGRYDTDGVVGGNWLDSNDTSGIKWDVGGLGKFNTLAFFLTDVADVGAKFSVKVGDTVFSDLAGKSGRLSNGNIQFVRVLLPEAVESLSVELIHDKLNDGFGIDGAMVAEVAPVPVPPAAALVLTGIAALAGLRRRRSARLGG